MAETYKILGQVAPTVSLQEKVLYSSPAATQTLVTNITVTNRSASNQTFDINVYDTAKVDSDFNPVATPAVCNKICWLVSFAFTISFLNDSTAAPVDLCCPEFSINNIGIQAIAH